jgi:hypothetical protein
MSDDPVVPAPARLFDEPTEVASLLSHAEAQYRSNIDEGQAWKRLRPELDAVPRKTTRRGILLKTLAAIVVALAIGWIAGAHYTKHAGNNTPVPAQN